MSKKKKRLLIGILTLLLAGAAGFSLWFYRTLHLPVTPAKAAEYIEIPRKSTPEGIANKLVSEGVLRQKWPLLFYIKLTGSAKLIKADEYRCPSPITPLRVLKKLEEGEQRLSCMTVN